MNYIAKLYGIEKQAKGLSASERQALRKQQAQPVLSEFKEWLDVQNVLPKGLLGKAITYTQNQWPKLLTYLENGNISIDNNVTERDISPFTTGRKNWMFSTSVGGAKASANLYSLVMTCRANDINPYYYFQYLFTELQPMTYQISCRGTLKSVKLNRLHWFINRLHLNRIDVEDHDCLVTSLSQQLSW